MTPNMKSACEARFFEFMAANYPDIPAYPWGQAVSEDDRLYVLFAIIASDETFPVGMGKTAKSRNVGLVQADVFGPKDVGGGETGDIAFAIGRVFHREDMEVPGEGLCSFKDSSVRELGEDGEEYRQVMRTPYRYDFQY